MGHHASRLWPLDVCRGVAIILMILFHLIVDLADVYQYNLDYNQGFWYIEGRLSAILFILLCGASTNLTRRSVRHGLQLLAVALSLTAVTYLYNEHFYIKFGILHFLGICLLLQPLINRYSTVQLVLLSGAAAACGLMLSSQFSSHPWLFPIGLRTAGFTSLDYYPLLPWLSLFITGMAAGRFIPGSWHLSPMPPATLAPVSRLGRHSLAVYLLHQPLLLSMLYLLHS